VVLDLGSTTYEDPAALTRLLVAAIEEAGVRAVIQRGWANLGDDGIASPNIHFTGYAPHTWLFPRAACVVSHGGCGTVAEAYRAGVPTVVIPAAFDHVWFVNRVAAAGWTREVIPFAELSASRLADAIRRTVNDAGYAAAARELQGVLNAEGGVRAGYEAMADMLRQRAGAVPVAAS
jgi:sterol 3beta-glucosyltransferase